MTHSVPIGPETDTGHVPPQATARTRTAYRRARRHSVVVKLLKYGLPVIGLGIAASMVGLFVMNSAVEVAATVDSVGFTDGKLVMENPKLDGETSANLPYNMKAARAIQDVSNANIITLEQIDAKLALSEDVTAVIGAQTGVFDKQNNTLDINSPIHVETSSGMVANLKSAQIDLEQGNLSTAEPVDIDMNGSHIAANSLTVTERGDVLLFENRVRVTIPAHRLQTASEEQ